MRYTNVTCEGLKRPEARCASPDSLVKRPRSGITHFNMLWNALRENQNTSPKVYKQVMPDLGLSTRKSGEERLATWRVSPSHVTLLLRTLIVAIGTFFCILFETIVKCKTKKRSSWNTTILSWLAQIKTSRNASRVRRFGHLYGSFSGSRNAPPR